MARAKFRTELNGLSAVVIISVEIPKTVEQLADTLGMYKQERDNLCNQKLTEIIQLLGNDDEVG